MFRMLCSPRARHECSWTSETCIATGSIVDTEGDGARNSAGGDEVVTCRTRFPAGSIKRRPAASLGTPVQLEARP